MSRIFSFFNFLFFICTFSFYIFFLSYSLCFDYKNYFGWHCLIFFTFFSFWPKMRASTTPGCPSALQWVPTPSLYFRNAPVWKFPLWLNSSWLLCSAAGNRNRISGSKNEFTMNELRIVCLMCGYVEDNNFIYFVLLFALISTLCWA